MQFCQLSLLHPLAATYIVCIAHLLKEDGPATYRPRRIFLQTLRLMIILGFGSRLS